MRIALLTFDGFDELDAFVSLGLLNRLSANGWKAEIASPSAQVTSMNGVTVQAQQPLEFANDADAVLFGSGLYLRAITQDSKLMDRLTLDPVRQLVGAQGSGVLGLARLGLLGDRPACTDAATKPWLIAAGVRVEDSPFTAHGPIASAGGAMASIYLATWLIASGEGLSAATQALRQIAPVGQVDGFVNQTLAVVTPFIPVQPT
jgi:transcriptional regulator GlxA family with amidase domain